MGVGIYIYFSLNFEPSYKQVFSLFFIPMLSFFIFWFLKKPQIVTAFILVVLVGFLSAETKTRLAKNIQLEMSLPYTNIEGVVKSISPRTNGYQADIKVSKKIKSIIGINLIRIYLNKSNKYNSLKSGYFFSGNCNLWPIPKPISKYDYNMRLDMYFKRIGALGKCSDIKVIKNKNTDIFTKIRESTSKSLESKFYKKHKELSIARAIITGEKKSITPEVRDRFIASGLAHLLAISGLHMSLLGGIFFFFIRRLFLITPLGESANVLKYCAVSALVLSFFYLGVSGFAIPAQRAFYMLMFFVFCILIHGSPWTMHFLSFSAIIVLITQPESMLSPSFQLSFAAVLGLVSHYNNNKRKPINYSKNNILKMSQKSYINIKLLLTTTLIASIATAPFTIYHFNQLNTQAFLGNLLAIPLMGFWVMPFAILSCISLIFGSGSDILFYFFINGVTLLIKITEYASSIPLTSISIRQFPSWSLSVCIFIGIYFFLVKGKSKYFISIFGVLFLIIFARPIKVPSMIKSPYFSAYIKNSNLYFLSMTSNQFQRDSLKKRYGIKKIIPMKNNESIELKINGDKRVKKISLKAPNFENNISKTSYFYFSEKRKKTKIEKKDWAPLKRPWNGY